MLKLARTLPVVVLLLVVVVSAVGLLLTRSADYPAPTGPQAVGRMSVLWADPSRPEVMTDDPADRREVVVHVWYPARPGPELPPAPYVPDYDQLYDALVESGEIDAFQLFGLRFVQTHALVGAEMADGSTPYPVVLFSPGNATNSFLYSALLEDLASHGFVVVAIDHPYDVAAAVLGDGRAVRHASEKWPVNAPGPVRPEEDLRARMYRERVEVRAADAAFVLSQLEKLDAEAGGRFEGRLDLERVGIIGHSVGGVAAAQSCQIDSRFRACLNLDGLAIGQPFYPDANGAGPTQPFMLLTKQATMPPEQFDNRLRPLLRAVTAGSYLVVIGDASHNSFGDSPTLAPNIVNPQAATADQITRVVRDYTRTFLARSLTTAGASPSASWPEYPGVTVETYGPGQAGIGARRRGITSQASGGS